MGIKHVAGSAFDRDWGWRRCLSEFLDERERPFLRIPSPKVAFQGSRGWVLGTGVACHVVLLDGPSRTWGDNI